MEANNVPGKEVEKFLLVKIGRQHLRVGSSKDVGVLLDIVDRGILLDDEWICGGDLSSEYLLVECDEYTSCMEASLVRKKIYSRAEFDSLKKESQQKKG